MRLFCSPERSTAVEASAVDLEGSYDSYVPGRAPNSQNAQLPSPYISYPFTTTTVYEILRRSRTSGKVLQTALCYLEAIRSKVPELAEKEKNDTSIQGEIDLTYRIVQGDLEGEEWRGLALDSVAT